jgi:hypothetical protein
MVAKFQRELDTVEQRGAPRKTEAAYRENRGIWRRKL